MLPWESALREKDNYEAALDQLNRRYNQLPEWMREQLQRQVDDYEQKHPK